MKGKNFLFGLIALLFGTIIALGLGEFTVRQLKLSKTWASYIDRSKVMEQVTNEGVGYRRKPNISFIGPRDVVYKTNELGFRDKTFVTHNSRKKKIAFIGDSVTEGFGVDPPNRYSNITETLAQNSDMQFESLNFGIAGFATVDELNILIKYVVPLKPAIAVLQFCQNDFQRNSEVMNLSKQVVDPALPVQVDTAERKPETKLLAPGENPIKAFLQNHSALYLFFAERYNYFKLRKNGLNSILLDSGKISPDEWNATVTTLDRFKSECDSNNIRLFMTYIPLEVEVVTGNEKLGKNLSLRLDTLCASLGITSINVIDTLRTYQSPTKLYLDDCHLSLVGNQIVARRIFEALKNN